MAKRFMLTRDSLSRLLAHPALYDTVPAAESLRETALQSWQLRKKPKQGCIPCQQATYDRNAMRAVCDAFVVMLRQWKSDNDTDTLAALRDWISTQRGTKPGNYIILYRKHKKAPLERITF